jgi:hypothetical protein
MRRLAILTALALPLFADSPAPLPTDFGAVGVGYDGGSTSHHAVPFAVFGHEFTPNMYSYTEAQVLGFSTRPLAAQTVLTTGICGVNKFIGEYIFLGACLVGGVANSNGSTGGVFGGTPLVGYRFTKSQTWAVVVSADFTKTALDSGTHTSIKLAVVKGWGK